MKQYKPYQLISLLTPFVFSFALGLDIYIPVVPQMAEIFNASPALIQLTLSLFLFMTGVGQLFIGPMADHWGRKAIFYLGAVLYVVGSFGCAYSYQIEWLILGRFVSAIGACGMLVTSFAIVRDLYSSDESAKMYSFLNGAVGISPTFAPIIGGILAYSFGWRSVFYCLTLVGLLAFWINHRYIQETLDKTQRVKIGGAIWKNYWQIFTHRQFIIYGLLAGLAEAIFFCFFSISPFIIIESLAVPSQTFGYYFAIFGLVIGLGGFGSGKLIERIGVQATLKTGFILMMIGGASMLAFAHPLSLPGFLIPMVLACTGAMCVVGSAASCALEPFGAIAGTASAAFGATQFSIASLAGSILMLFPVHTTVPYGIAILLLALLSCGLFYVRPQQVYVDN